MEREVHKAVSQAKIMLQAIPAPAGEQVVVLGPGGPEFYYTVTGHGLEGDFNRKKISVFTELMNSSVASKEVTVFDDGTISDRRGSYTIDDEERLTKNYINRKWKISKLYVGQTEC